MRPRFSEFSYGYALTRELQDHAGYGFHAMPVFPTQAEEGQQGGGYDVRLRGHGVPIFLQFKVGDKMIRGNAREARVGSLDVPYYRMRIMGSRYSAQHSLLLDLEASGNLIFYVSSGFGDLPDWEHHYRGRTIRSHSLWLRPSQVGQFHDEDDHYVAFQVPGNWVVRSEPVKGEGPHDFEGANQIITRQIDEVGEQALSEQRLEVLANQAIELAATKLRIDEQVLREIEESISPFTSIQRLAYVSSVLFDAALLVAHS